MKEYPVLSRVFIAGFSLFCQGIVVAFLIFLLWFEFGQHNERQDGGRSRIEQFCGQVCKRSICDTTKSRGVLQALPAVRSKEEKRDFLLPLTAVKGKKGEVRRRWSSIL